MIIDCHIHYDPRVLTMDRMLACMDKHSIDQAALIATMVEPFYLDSRMRTAAGDLLRYLLIRANSLGQVFYSTTIDGKGNFVLLGRKYRICEKPDNAPVAEALKEHPDRLKGWIFVNPAAPGDPMEEVERWSSSPGMIGIKAHPFWHRYPIGSLDGVAAWCRDRGFPLLIHLGCRKGSGDYRRLPEKYPGLKLIYAHAGIPFYRKLWAYIKDKAEVYVDLSSPYLNRDLARNALDYLGADKCLYGTDGPYGHQAPGGDYDYGLIKGWLESLPLSDGEFEKVFGGNFQRISGEA